jgi:hypothetical protein
MGLPRHADASDVGAKRTRTLGRIEVRKWRQADILQVAYVG